MSFTTPFIIIIIIIALGTIVAAVLLIKQSASKFELSNEQQEKVDLRKAEQVKKDVEEQ
ncbi:MAG: DUF2897 family protein [Cognaticolwellia sp.]